MLTVVIVQIQYLGNTVQPVQQRVPVDKQRLGGLYGVLTVVEIGFQRVQQLGIVFLVDAVNIFADGFTDLG